VVVHFGTTGLGKTLKAQEEAGDGAHWRDPVKQWWGDYAGEENVVFDEFNGSWFPLDYLKRLFDRSPMRVEVKGSDVAFAAKTIWVTSNREPWLWYPGAKEVDFYALVRRVDEWWAFREEGAYCFRGGDELGRERYDRFVGFLNGGEPGVPRGWTRPFNGRLDVDSEEEL